MPHLIIVWDKVNPLMGKALKHFFFPPGVPHLAQSDMDLEHGRVCSVRMFEGTMCVNWKPGSRFPLTGYCAVVRSFILLSFFLCIVCLQCVRLFFLLTVICSGFLVLHTGLCCWRCIWCTTFRCAWNPWPKYSRDNSVIGILIFTS